MGVIKMQFSYLKLRMNQHYMRIKPVPSSYDQLVHFCKPFLPEKAHKHVFCYIDGESNHVKISNTKDLLQCYEESVSIPKIELKRLMKSTHTEGDSTVISLTETPKVSPNAEYIFNHCYLTHNDLIKSKDIYDYSNPTAFFKRTAQHIVHIAQKTSYEFTSSFFKIKVSLIKHLEILVFQHRDFPYAISSHVKNDLGKNYKKPKISIKPSICFKIVDQINRKLTTMDHAKIETGLSEDVIKKWIALFANYPGYSVKVPPHSMHTSRFIKYILKEFLLDRYSENDIFELFRIEKANLYKLLYYYGDMENNYRSPQVSDLEPEDNERISE